MWPTNITAVGGFEFRSAERVAHWAQIGTFPQVEEEYRSQYGPEHVGASAEALKFYFVLENFDHWYLISIARIMFKHLFNKYLTSLIQFLSQPVN